MNKLYFALLVFIFACKTSSKINDGVYQNLYDFESQAIHPEVLAYHFSDDSTRIFYSLEPSELLFSRENLDAPFLTNVLIKYKVQQRTTDTLVVLQEHQFKLNQKSDNRESEQLVGFFDIPLTGGAEYNLELKFKDANRNSEVTAHITLDKEDIFSRQNFLPTSGGIPLWGYQISSSGLIEITCERCKINKIELFTNTEKLKLPPPPFSDSRRQTPKPSDGLESTKELIEDKLELSLTSGMCFLTQDPNKTKGLTLHVRDDFFPNVMTVEKMVQSIRYITSRSEYEALNSSPNMRKSVEKLWIDIAGNKNKARELIRFYYNRVREANIYFSNLAPGWKTDRGLIHIIYGNPKKIFIHPDSEVWLYGEEDNVNSLKFTFREIPNIYPGKNMILNRDHVYKTNWDRAVTTWRNGRIYSE